MRCAIVEAEQEGGTMTPEYLRLIEEWAAAYDNEEPPMTAAEYKTLLDEAYGEEGA